MVRKSSQQGVSPAMSLCCPWPSLWLRQLQPPRTNCQWGQFVVMSKTHVRTSDWTTLLSHCLFNSFLIQQIHMFQWDTNHQHTQLDQFESCCHVESHVESHEIRVSSSRLVGGRGLVRGFCVGLRGPLSAESFGSEHPAVLWSVYEWDTCIIMVYWAIHTCIIMGYMYIYIYIFVYICILWFTENHWNLDEWIHGTFRISNGATAMFHVALL